MRTIPPYLTKEFIEQNILTSNGGISSSRLKKLGNLTVDQVYQVYHNMSGPSLCYCGNETKLKSFSQGYHKYCSAKCSANSPSTAATRKNSNLVKYGVEAYSQTPEFAASISKTRSELPEEKKLATLKKRAATSLSRFGYKSVLQSPEVRQRGIDTRVKRYGVEHAMQSADLLATAQATRVAKWFPAKLTALSSTVIPKFDATQYTNIDGKYLWACAECGTEFTSRLSDGRVPRCPTCFPYGYRSSKVELEIVAYLQSLGVSINTSVRTIIPPQELDIVLDEYKIAIEVNGEYWHSELQGRGKDYHINKTIACQNTGYRLIHIFTSEWANNPELVKSRLKSVLGLNTTVYGRNCSISTKLTHAQTTEFMDNNHIQGACSSSVNIGLINKLTGELLAVMTFGKSRYNKEIEWELLRYASKQGINVVGGASKLFAQFIRLYHPASIISYCDLRWNTGNLYSKLGFTHSHSSPPNFRYTADYVNFASRHKFQKHKLPALLPIFDLAASAWENMKANGYDRIWDCGNSVWIWRA